MESLGLDIQDCVEVMDMDMDMEMTAAKRNTLRESGHIHVVLTALKGIAFCRRQGFASQLRWGFQALVNIVLLGACIMGRGWAWRFIKFSLPPKMNSF